MYLPLGCLQGGVEAACFQDSGFGYHIEGYLKIILKARDEKVQA
jgi:hypothetical protein